MIPPVRLLVSLLAASVLAASAYAASPPQFRRVMIRLNETLPVDDRIVLHKAERRLDLMRGYGVLRSYHIALGLNPIGQKQRSGDFRTPEGTYYLARRNARSDFFLSIQVSY